MIRFGIVGIGGFAATWVRCLQELEREGTARLAAAVVRRPDHYRDRVARLEGAGCSIYPDLDAMLAAGRASLDVIGIPTGIAYHEPMATRAMEAGYDVMIEKPVAGTLQEATRLQEVERRTGRWCAVDYQWLHSPTARWIVSRLVAGSLGRVREARGMISWPRDSAYYARNAWAGQLRHGDRWILDGPATNATAHYLTQMLYYVAAQQRRPIAIEAVRAELYRAKPIPSYDTSCLEVLMPEGARVLHYASHAVTQQHEPVIHLDCEGGSVDWTAEGDAAVIRYADGREERYANPAPERVHTLPFEQTARVAAGEEPAPLCGLAEGVPHVLAINLAFESSHGVLTLPPDRLSHTLTASEGELIAAEGMDDALRQAYATGAMFSEMNLPWARATETVPAISYVAFPRAAELRRALEAGA
jgi:predicted dehydrogenase